MSQPVVEPPSAPPADAPGSSIIPSIHKLETENEDIRRRLAELEKPPSPKAKRDSSRLWAAWLSLVGAVGIAGVALYEVFDFDGGESFGMSHVSHGLAIIAAFAFAYALMRTSVRLFLSEDSVVEIERAQIQAAARQRKAAPQELSPPAEVVKSIGEALVEVAKSLRQKD